MAVWKGNVVILILYMIVESISVSVPQYNIYTYHTYIYIYISYCTDAAELRKLLANGNVWMIRNNNS